jgi:RIO-like serine/threonine protein kinase
VRRNDDLLRNILIETEEQTDWLVLISQVISPSKDQRERGYHVQLLCDAGLMTQVSASGFRMTNQGHDYLEAIRSDTIWNKTKQGAAEVGGMTLGMMKDVAVALLKQKASEMLGINL